MASSGGENMTSWIANKRKSSSTATQISEGNRSRGDRSGKRPVRERELEWEQKTRLSR